MPPTDEVRNMLVLVGDAFELAESGEVTRSYTRLWLAAERAGRLRDQQVPVADELVRICDAAMAQFRERFGEPEGAEQGKWAFGSGSAAAQAFQADPEFGRNTRGELDDIRQRLGQLGQSHAGDLQQGREIQNALGKLNLDLEDLHQRLKGMSEPERGSEE